MLAKAFRLGVLAAFLGVCVGGTGPSASQPATAKDISEITLVRDGAAGSPADVLTFHSDGSVFYEGKHDTTRVGVFTGRLRNNFSGEVFPQLAARFVEMISGGPVSRGKPANINPVVIRVTQDGKVKEFTDWCPGLDERLWAFEMAARGLMEETTWTKTRQ
jgi:hypothetical protein